MYFVSFNNIPILAKQIKIFAMDMTIYYRDFSDIYAFRRNMERDMFAYMSRRSTPQLLKMKRSQY